MNTVDATCLHCNRPMRLVTGKHRYCSQECFDLGPYTLGRNLCNCQVHQVAAQECDVVDARDDTVDSGYVWGIPETRLTDKEIQNLTRWCQIHAGEEEVL